MLWAPESGTVEVSLFLSSGAGGPHGRLPLVATCVDQECLTSTRLLMSSPDLQCLPDACPTQISSVGQGRRVLSVWDGPSSRLPSQHNFM